MKYHYLSGACRIKALGYDRNHVQYIYLDAFVGAVDELGGYEDYISTQKYREKCVSGLNWGAGRLFVGTPSPSGDGGRNWGYLCEPEQVKF